MPSTIERRISRERSAAKSLRSLVATKVPTTDRPVTMGATTTSVGRPARVVESVTVEVGGRDNHCATRGHARTAEDPGVERRPRAEMSMTMTSPGAIADVSRNPREKVSRSFG